MIAPSFLRTSDIVYQQSRNHSYATVITCPSIYRPSATSTWRFAGHETHPPSTVSISPLTYKLARLAK